MLFSKWIYCTGISFNIGALTYAFTANCMNDASNTMLILFDFPSQYDSLIRSTLTTTFYIGCLCGAVISKNITQFRKAILFADIFFCLGSLLLVFDNFYIFILGRLITGIGGGIESVCLALFIRQFTPTQLFSSVGGLMPSIFSIGYILTTIFGLFFENTKGKTKNDLDPLFWRLYFIIGAIPSLIRLILLVVYYNFESPQYYIINNQESYARKILSKQYKSQQQIEEQIQILQPQQTQVIDGLKQPYIQQLKYGLFLVFFAQFCGFNAVLQYSNIIFEDSYSETVSKRLTFMISVIKTPLYLFTAQFISVKYGRCKPMIIGAFIMMIAHFGIGIFSYLEEYQIVSYFVFVYLISQFTSTGPLAFLLLSEITVGQQYSICQQVSWIYSIIILYCFPILRDYFGQTSIFFLFGFLTLCCGIYMAIFRIETLGKNNEEIHQLFIKNNNYNKVIDE